MHMNRRFSLMALLFALISVSSLSAAVPALLNYQGRVVVNGTNYDGTGQFQFALVNTGTNASRQATGTAILTGIFVTSVNITDGGAGYTSAPTVGFSGGGGSNAAANAEISGGAVTNIVMTSAGTGYVSPPSVLIAPPPATTNFTTYWSNGTGTVSVPVSKGLYSVLLGNTNTANMAAIPPTVFSNTDVRLRVWFDDGSGLQQLMPDQQLVSAPYALSVAGAIGAGLADANTFFISSTAPAGGDGSMSRPWNSLYALTNNAGRRLDGKTVIILPGFYTTSSQIVFGSTGGPYTNLTIKGLDPQNTRILSTHNSNSIFRIYPGAANIVFEGMTMTSTNTLNGGAALSLLAGCTVKDCIFINNSCGTYDGGAIYLNQGGDVLNCTFSGNSAYSGGALNCSGASRVQHCTFKGNSATTYGGAAYFNNGGIIQNCSFDNNSSSLYGGTAFFSGNGLMRNCIINGSAASSHGGGAFLNNGGTMQDCLFTANSSLSGLGGGAFCSNGGTIQNSIFTENYSSGSGGAIYCSETGTVQNCSVVRGGGNTNSVGTTGSGVKWMSVWTNNTSASDFVIYSTSLDN